MDVVLVPGFMTDDWLWGAVAEEFGTIGTLFYANLGLDGSVEAFADRTLAEAPARFLLVGFSMGGYIAREMARLAPDRVAGLVLVATSSRPEAPKLSPGGPGAASTFNGLSRRAVLSSIHPDRASDEAMVSGIRSMGIRLGGDVFARQSSMRREGDNDRLAGIACPTLVVAARQDRLRGVQEAQELVDGIPDATMAIIEGSGHMIPLETPRELAQLIRSWWGSLLPQQAP